jgi:hypothetical protein
MLFRKLSLSSAALLILWPSISVADSFPTQRRSNLPCLIGQPGFSERLIANNPKAFGRGGNFLWHSMATVQFPLGPLSMDELKQMHFPKFSRWEEYVEYTITELSAVGNMSALGEIAIYFNRLTMLYLSSLRGKLLNSFAVVIGNVGDERLNCHASIGKFPIPFGASFSEYTLARVLQADLGATLNAPAVSFNGGYRWNLENETKWRVFGFIGDLVSTSTGEKIGANPVNASKSAKKKEKIDSGIDRYWGINLQHEWISLAGSVSLGISYVSGVPIRVIQQAQDGINLYMHGMSGPFKLKVEGLKGGVTKWLQGEKSDRKTKSDRKAKLEDYTAHAELAYRLPFKKESSVVVGYTQGMSGFLAAQKRGFLGFKANLLENLQCLVGYQCEHGLKRMPDTPRARKYVTNDEKGRYQEWRNSVTVQFNFTI